jgi:hypothetical protein
MGTVERAKNGASARRTAPRRWAGLTALRCGLAAVGLLGLPGRAVAADPAPRVKPRALPGERAAPARPDAAPARPDAAPAKPGAGAAKGGSDRGGTGPRKERKPGERPDGEAVAVFAPGTPIAVVRAAFACALERGDSAGFDCYAALNMLGNRDNATAREHLRRYQWSHFRKWAPTYVLPGKGFSVLVTRRDPATTTAETREVKLYLWSNKRDHPAPITLRREAGGWRIYANSL